MTVDREQHIVWNFCLSKQSDTSTLNDILQQPTENNDQTIKWEKRYFWSDDIDTITLHGLDDSFLAISDYRIKSQHDDYIIDTNSQLNCKIRNDRLIIKPLQQVVANICGFDHKQKHHLPIQQEEVSLYFPQLSNPQCYDKMADLLAALKQSSTYYLIKLDKDVLQRKLEKSSKTKLELVRLQINGRTYYSLCIESYDRFKVEAIAELLNVVGQSCDYITFLKGLDTHD